MAGVFVSVGGVLTLAPALGGRADSDFRPGHPSLSVSSSLTPFLRL